VSGVVGEPAKLELTISLPLSIKRGEVVTVKEETLDRNAMMMAWMPPNVHR
jgi:hypothetical protein